MDGRCFFNVKSHQAAIHWCTPWVPNPLCTTKSGLTSPRVGGGDFFVDKVGNLECTKLFMITLPKTRIAPENRPSQKETSLPIIHLRVRAVSFREGSQCKYWIFMIETNQEEISWKCWKTWMHHWNPLDNYPMPSPYCWWLKSGVHQLRDR